jgi:hypothetical protein
MTSPLRSLPTIATALFLAAAAAGLGWAADAPAPAAPPVQPVAPSVSTPVPSVRPPVAAASAPAPKPAARSVRAESHPTWNELNPQQQQSLAPLAGTWRTLSESHKRKWLALSKNYHSMPPAEQARLHSRMAEWANLSPQQRTIARMNYAATQAVPANDKKAKWEAYQALSPEEKRKLASRAAAAKPVPSTAVNVHPGATPRLARIPKPKKPESAARLAGIPGQVDQNTLLPQPGALPNPP